MTGVPSSLDQRRGTRRDFPRISENGMLSDFPLVEI
jgi:hypothetical protein